MVLLFIPFHNYFEKKDKERNNKALDFYESEINMTVNSYLTGSTFTINDIDYKYSKKFIDSNKEYFYKPSKNKKSPILQINNLLSDDTGLINWTNVEVPYIMYKGRKSDSLIIIQNGEKYIFYLQDWKEY